MDKRQPPSPFFSGFSDILQANTPTTNSIAMDSFASFNFASYFPFNFKSEEVETPTEFESDGGEKTLVPNCVIA